MPRARDVEVDILGHRNLLRVNLEDLFAATDIGAIDDDATIEAAGAQKRRVEDVGAVGGGD